MNNTDFDFKRLDKGIAGGEHKIIFKTSDGKIYEDCEITVESDKQHHHTCVVNLINSEEVRPPVEDSIKLDGFNARFAKDNVITHNLDNYPLIKNMINVIIKASNKGEICHTFIIPYVTKHDTFEVYYDEDEICGVIRWHFKELGFNVKDKNDEVNNRTEFFISW